MTNAYLIARNLFQKHEVATVGRAGFKGLKNGELLKAAATSGFEVLVSVDQNLAYQQNLKDLPLAVIILKAKRTKYETLAPLAPKVLQTLERIQPGQLVVVEAVFG